MGIYVEEDNFHMQTKNCSYIFRILEDKGLQQIYFGKKICRKNKYDNLSWYEKRGLELYTEKEKSYLRLGTIRQEYSSYGRGDFRHPAYQVKLKNGSRITELKYKSYEVNRGKKKIQGLPSVFAEEDSDVETLKIILTDELINLDVILNYTVFPKFDTIVRNVEFYNRGNEDLILLKAMSLQLDLPDANYDFIHFSGAWLRERNIYRTTLRPGIQGIDSIKYSSSHQQNPFFMLARLETTEFKGEVLGFNFIYSGNFQNIIEVDHFHTARITIGINTVESEFLLSRKDSFITPEAIISYTDKGFNTLSQQLSEFYKNHLMCSKFSKTSRPILLNSWEGMYYDFDDNKLLSLASKAKELGIELLVVDDGWFGKRKDDRTSLGDWNPSLDRFPKGIGEFAKKVHKLGIKFGLWFEPEMISLESNLYERYPEWLVKCPERLPAISRNQYVLDFTRKEVVDYIFNSMSKVIDEAELDYIKWDMNRYISDSYSANLSASQQMEFSHRYILGVYRLYEKLTVKYPDILFESCASGGGRFDLGMMHYAPQAWTSDNTDPIERLKIQYGTSYGYSISMMGTHVSDVPNQQTGRVTSLEFRSSVAYFGVFGYELDITKLSNEETTEIKEQIRFYQKYREIFQHGIFYRLRSPFMGSSVSWQVVSKDQSISIVAYYQMLNEQNPGFVRLYCMGLDENKMYSIDGFNEIFSGSELMYAGLNIFQKKYQDRTVAGTQDFLVDLFIINEMF